MYKIETHLHTKHTSKCGWLWADQIADAYAAAGYSAIAVTDHYNRTTFEYLNVDLASSADKLDAFLTGYHKLKEACAKRGILVYRGAELRFDECDNDYLFYDWPDDLLREPGQVIPLGIAAFSPLARKVGALLIQAHPYRKGCTPAIPSYLDGVEILNLNPRHENYNARAVEFADQFHLDVRTGGSDCHRIEDVATSGILSKTLPADTHAFAQLLRSGDFTLLGA